MPARTDIGDEYWSDPASHRMAAVDSVARATYPSVMRHGSSSGSKLARLTLVVVLGMPPLPGPISATGMTRGMRAGHELAESAGGVAHDSLHGAASPDEHAGHSGRPTGGHDQDHGRNCRCCPLGLCNCDGVAAACETPHACQLPLAPQPLQPGTVQRNLQKSPHPFLTPFSIGPPSLHS